MDSWGSFHNLAICLLNVTILPNESRWLKEKAESRVASGKKFGGVDQGNLTTKLVVLMCHNIWSYIKKISTRRTCPYSSHLKETSTGEN